MNGTEVEVIRAEVMPIPEYARLIVVIDQQSMAQANEMFLTIKSLRKKIAETMDPIISAAHKVHKVANDKKKELEAPLILAESWLNGQISIYDERQEKIRKKEGDRLYQIELEKETARRKEEEGIKLAQAAILEQAGAKDEAEQLMTEALQENEAPLAIKIPEPPTPKVVMTGMAMVTTWKFRVINESLIPRKYLVIDAVSIGGIVRALKDKTNIPGIQAYPETKARPTGR